MRLIYITFINVFNENNRGVHKKILSQCKALQRLISQKVLYTTHVFETAFLMYGEEIVEKELAIDREMYCEVIKGWINKYDVDSIYARYLFSDGIMNKFYKEEKNRGTRMVVEIPTFPYEKELSDGLCKYEDKLFREEIAKQIDCFTTYSEDTYIWERPCIRLTNGIESETILNDSELNGSVIHDSVGSIKMVAVLTMNPWHGLERIIQGLYEYYNSGQKKETNVILTVIGEGQERKRYESLKSKYKLDEYIKFVGSINSNELKKYYNDADIAIGSLGLYKYNIHDASPIKVAEYSAYGLPTICGYHDMRFENGVPFIHEVPNDASSIDINETLEWHKELLKDRLYRKKILEYAKRNLTWDNIMRPVVDYYLIDR